MIHVAVSVQRSFLFPADLETASAYFRNFERVLAYLPHLRLITTYAKDQFRVLYSATEAGLYHLSFYCDLQVYYVESERTLHVTPLTGFSPVPARVDLHSIIGQGYYSSKSVFLASGRDTRVDYEVEITATVPKRLEWSLIPDWVVEYAAENRTKKRLSKMTDGFIARAIDEFRS